MITITTRAAAGLLAGAALAILTPGAGCSGSRPLHYGYSQQEVIGQPLPEMPPAPPPPRIQRFPAEQLYGHIDGGAELFLEFGFEELIVETHQLDSLQVDLEIYRMESWESALAIYLAKCGREQPRADLPGRNTVNPYQITMVHERDFVQANNFSGKPAGLEYAAALLRRWPAHRRPLPPLPVLDLLSSEDLLPGSEALVRGQFSLQPIVTLGEGDILQLGGKTWGAVGSYERPQGEPEIRVYVRYPDAAAARGVLESVLANLDPYLTVTERGADGFTYTDWRGWPGRVSVAGPLLVVHVPAEPATPPAPVPAN